MNRWITYCLIVFSFFSSCEKRNFDNPFDPDCPKELFTPSNFQAVQEDSVISLSWDQANMHISGFTIERSLDGTTWTSWANLSKSETETDDENITGGQAYFYRLTAQAGGNPSNSVETSVTPVFASKITTLVVSSLTMTSAILGGNITDDGGTEVTARGICWNTDPNPTIQNSKTADGTGTGIFESTLSRLMANTTYYARAYSTNSKGTSYGNQIVFKTYYGEVTDIDGNVYGSVLIGDQEWLAVDLKVTSYNDGTPIPNIEDGTEWSDLTSGAYCWQKNLISNKDAYGALYNWHAVNTQKLCPSGWHVPLYSEWEELVNYLGGTSVAGGKMKETGTEHWVEPNEGATNISGFSALPGGWRADNNGTFQYLGRSFTFYASDERDTTTAYSGYILTESEGIHLGYSHKRRGRSVRCIKGEYSKDVSLPKVSTFDAGSITVNSAVLGGMIVDDGGASITERGIVFIYPEELGKIPMGNGSGEFSATVNGLNPNWDYHVAAYAVNSKGIAYGDTVFFYTPQAPKSVTDIDGNLYNTVSIGTQVWMAENLKTTKYNDGTIIPNVIVDDIWTNITSETTTLMNLDQIISGGGDSYTLAQLEGGGMITQLYRIQIEIWLTDLGYTEVQINSMTISQINNVMPNGPGARCWYDNDATTYRDTYGALYNWYTVNTGKLCPQGWHVPTQSDWDILANYLGDNTVAGGKIKEAGYTHWDSPNTGATNSSGLTVLGAGYRSQGDGSFNSLKQSALFWTPEALSSDPESSYRRNLEFDREDLIPWTSLNTTGFSIRCIKD